MKTLPPNGPFVSNSFQSSHYKNYQCNHCFFFSSPPFFLLPLFLFLLSFSFTSVILELIGPKNLPFDAFSLKWHQFSLNWFSKSWLDMYNVHTYLRWSVHGFNLLSTKIFIFHLDYSSKSCSDHHQITLANFNAFKNRVVKHSPSNNIIFLPQLH